MGHLRIRTKNAINAHRVLNIGEVANASGVSAKMVRHYESIGLIPQAQRTMSNYRTYSEKDVHTLQFIHQARNLGFSIVQIGNLLALWQDRRRSSRKVKELAAAHIEELEHRIAELQAMKHTLQALAARCHGDDRPECPILENLERADSSAAQAAMRAVGLRSRRHVSCLKK